VKNTGLFPEEREDKAANFKNNCYDYSGGKMMKTAGEIMTAAVITVGVETSVQELARLLAEHAISGAPVVDDNGALLGVVTENDLIDQSKKLHIPTVVTILDSFIYLEKPDKMEKEMKKMAGSTVGDIFTRDVVTVNLETLIEEIATIMAEQRIHTLPVLKEGRLVGVIGKGDIIKTLLG
jgi:CBS domain-containing protein